MGCYSIGETNKTWEGLFEWLWNSNNKESPESSVQFCHRETFSGTIILLRNVEFLESSLIVSFVLKECQQEEPDHKMKPVRFHTSLWRVERTSSGCLHAVGSENGMSRSSMDTCPWNHLKQSAQYSSRAKLLLSFFSDVWCLDNKINETRVGKFEIIYPTDIVMSIWRIFGHENTLVSWVCSREDRPNHRIWLSERHRRATRKSKTKHSMRTTRREGNGQCKVLRFRASDGRTKPVRRQQPLSSPLRLSPSWPWHGTDSPALNTCKCCPCWTCS